MSTYCENVISNGCYNATIRDCGNSSQLYGRSGKLNMYMRISSGSSSPSSSGTTSSTVSSNSVSSSSISNSNTSCSSLSSSHFDYNSFIQPLFNEYFKDECLNGPYPQDTCRPEEHRTQVFAPPSILSGATRPTFAILNRDWTHDESITIFVTLPTRDTGTAQGARMGTA